MIAASFGPGAGRNIGSPRCEPGLGVLVFAFRMLFSVQSETSAQLSTCQLQAEAVGCESGCLCALAPHGAGDCLPRVTAPQSIALFPLRAGVFARRIGTVAGDRVQSGPRVANAGKSRI